MKYSDSQLTISRLVNDESIEIISIVYKFDRLIAILFRKRGDS